MGRRNPLAGLSYMAITFHNERHFQVGDDIYKCYVYSGSVEFTPNGQNVLLLSSRRDRSYLAFMNYDPTGTLNIPIITVGGKFGQGIDFYPKPGLGIDGKNRGYIWRSLSREDYGGIIDGEVWTTDKGTSGTGGMLFCLVDVICVCGIPDSGG